MKEGGLASSGRRGCYMALFACPHSTAPAVKERTSPTVTARRPMLSLRHVVWQSLLEQVNTTQTTLLSLSLTALGHIIVAGGC